MRVQPNRQATIRKAWPWWAIALDLLAKQRGYVFVSRGFRGAKVRYLWRCGEGHEWKGCLICSRYWALPSEVKKLSVDEIRQFRQEKKRKGDCEYYQVHKKEKRVYDRQYERERRKTDLLFRLVRNMRARIRMAIKHGCKTGSSVQDLGCSISELKRYLEGKFEPGMTWENWRRDGWHIDHIRPLSSFDLTDRVQFLEAVHYSNLQPLWAKDNLSKGGCRSKIK